MTATKEATMIRLSQTAPWNPAIRNPYRTRYTQVDGRYFKVTAISLDAMWFIYEIDADGETLNDDPETAFVALVGNLAHARAAIELRVAGKTTDEISRAVAEMPRIGTGRNHPKHVQARRNWRP